MAHFLHTGPEILRQTGGRLDVFCDFAGTGGTFAGVSAALKQYNPQIKCFIVEPASAAVLAGNTVTNPNHRIQGGGYSMKAKTPQNGITPTEMEYELKASETKPIELDIHVLAGNCQLLKTVIWPEIDILAVLSGKNP